MTPEETNTLTAWLEVLVLEFNAIFKITRTKKFRDLNLEGSDLHEARISVYAQRQFQLSQEIDKLKVALGGQVTLWDGLFK